MREAFYVVELFSGNGSVSRVISRVLGVKAIRLDMDPEAGADITIDLTKWDKATAAEVKRLAGATEANRKRAVIWASPPCTEYSMLKGGRPRDLEGADACVAAVGRIARDLDAAVVLIENPATGLLKRRDVITPYTHSCQLDYCQYGYAYRKRTMIWSSLPLPPSFVPKTCPGYPGCPCTYKNPETGKTGHIIDMCADESLSQRISVPDHLASLVGRALAEMLPPLAHEPRPPPTPTQRQKSQKCWQVDYIEQGLMEDGELWLKIHWVGYDLPTWDTCDQLDAHPADYDYLSDETRQWVVLRYEALQKQQQQQQEEEEQQQQQQEQRQPRKRQLRVQQQQPQRRTRRSRSAAAGSSSNANSSSSGSSSSGYSNPLLEDGCSDHHHHVTN